MDKKEIAEVVRRMMAAPSCCAEARAAGQRWLDALGKAGEAAEAQSLIAELEADLLPIDLLIAFTGSAEGAALLGAMPYGFEFPFEFFETIDFFLVYAAYIRIGYIFELPVIAWRELCGNHGSLSRRKNGKSGPSLDKLPAAHIDTAYMTAERALD